MQFSSSTKTLWWLSLVVVEYSEHRTQLVPLGGWFNMDVVLRQFSSGIRSCDDKEHIIN